MSQAREIRIAAMRASVDFMGISGGRSWAHDKQKSRLKGNLLFENSKTLKHKRA